MSKQNVINRVQESLNDESVTQQQIGAVFNAVFETLSDLDQDQSCRIRDFGIFKVKRREAREGSKIGGEGTVQIPARLAMTFKISKNFKDALPVPVTETKKKAPKKAAKKKAAKKKTAKKK